MGSPSGLLKAFWRPAQADRQMIHALRKTHAGYSDMHLAQTRADDALGIAEARSCRI
jgi:hypothetical protein